MIVPLTGKPRRSVEMATARLNIWDGSVRSAKTVSSTGAWLNFIRNGPPGNLLMVGKTERTLKRNIIDPLVELIGPKRCRHIIGSGEVWTLGRRIYTAGANDERSLTKIQGMTLAGAYGDEISTWPESFFKMLLSRLSIEGAKFFGTTNSDSPNHWLLDEYLKQAMLRIEREGALVRNDRGLDLHRFSFVLNDNETLPAAYKEALKREYVGLWRKRYVEGRWVLAEGAIYDMLDRERHVISELPDKMECTWLLIDYGTTNPFVALLLGLAEEKFYVCREWRWDSKKQQRQLTDTGYSQQLHRWMLGLDFPVPEKVIIDPSATSFIVQLYDDGRKHDDWRATATKANNEVLDGIRGVSSLIAADRLFIHDSCVGLLDEMQGYVWDPRSQKLGEDTPIKASDHGPDALRYGIRHLRPIWRHWINKPVGKAA